MDWLRRNWPDLLIGVALVAVIAGIIATLVSGGSFFPVGNRSAETPRTSQGITAGQTPGEQQSQPGVDQASQPAAAQPDQQGSSLSSSVGSQEPPAVSVDREPAEEPVAEAPPASQSAQEEEPAQQSSVEALPPDGGAASPAASASETPVSSVTSSASQPQAQPASTPVAASGPPASASSDDEAPYRVSVGAFGNPENAQRQLETFEEAGYPVFIGTQGDLNIVLVGPYDTESEARSVAARIAGSSLGVSDPTVYRFEPDEESASTSQPAASSSVAASEPADQAEAPAQPAATPQAAQTATPGTRYLQVGAYGSRDSSLPQRERLEDMGFVVSDRVEGDLVKLLIGPFDAGQLADARSRLQSAGIESFPR